MKKGCVIALLTPFVLFVILIFALFVIGTREKASQHGSPGTIYRNSKLAQNLIKNAHTFDISEDEARRLVNIQADAKDKKLIASTDIDWILSNLSPSNQQSNDKLRRVRFMQSLFDLSRDPNVSPTYKSQFFDDAALYINGHSDLDTQSAALVFMGLKDKRAIPLLTPHENDSNYGVKFMVRSALTALGVKINIFF
jgi:hypothetical protein